MLQVVTAATSGWCIQSCFLWAYKTVQMRLGCELAMAAVGVAHKSVNACGRDLSQPIALSCMYRGPALQPHLV